MIWNYLKSTKKPILLYGMGNGAEIMIKQLAKLGVKVQGFFASDEFVRGQEFLGKRVLTFSEAKEQFPDMIALISFGTSRKEVIQNIVSLDCEKYAPEVPVVGEQVFDLDFCRKHRAELEEVYSFLEDEASKNTFKELIAYKLDGKIEHLFASESGREDVYKILKLKDENMLDLGAYTGDTAIEFAPFCKKITAVEPDEKNFKKLVKNTQELNITAINAAVSDKNGKIEFSVKGGRNSRVGEGKIIDALSVDSLNEDFSFIKLDVEGEEKNAILGAQNTIKHKPKLLVSAYHKSEDIFALPLLIKKINPEYKVYLRRPRYIPAWDTEYLFI